jgi:Ser/Thr protein kinase RdoA (MazF antagonist)
VGVINKLFFRGNFLGKPRHRNLFLDMEENIHIHYRDLRIELGRAEFEEFAQVFTRQSVELLQIIEEKAYEDGRLPNANQEDVRIWTESRLKAPVKYHPQRVSVEACSDGYHLHYRNYKILIDEADFRTLVDEFKALEIDGPDAATHREVLELLVANDIDCLRSNRDAEPRQLGLLVAPHHVRKVENVLENIGFERAATTRERRYTKGDLEVLVDSTPDKPAIGYGMWAGQARLGSLLGRLKELDETADRAELNYLKCQVVDAYFALRKGTRQPFDTDYRNWGYDRARARIVFPSLAADEQPRFDPDQMYRTWAAHLREQGQGFIKPGKRHYSHEQQQRLLQLLDEAVARLGKHSAVNKVYLMGSGNRGQLGIYDVPFMHGRWAKLGSDFDLLIEVVPGREGEIPSHWEYVSHSASNDCDVYHVGQIPMLEESLYPDTFPSIDFYHHLLDAYVYLPSRSDEAAKDAFLKRFGARLIWEWRGEDDAKTRAQMGKVDRLLKSAYAMDQVRVEAWRVSTRNAVYRVIADGREFVLKQFLVAGNYNHGRISEHVHYEAALVRILAARGIATAAIIPLANGDAVATLDGAPALLFERLHGTQCKRPEYPLDRVAEAIAGYHLRQIEQPIPLEAAFTFDQMWEIWRTAFDRYRASGKQPEELAGYLDSLAPLLEETDRAYREFQDRSPLPQLHCHGDLAPKNVMLLKDGRAVLFDFNNAFYGSRLFDLIDAAYEFALAEKYVKLIDFSRFKQLIDHYILLAPLTADEQRALPVVVRLFGLLKFTKEVRGYEEVAGSTMRTARATAIARFLQG